MKALRILLVILLLFYFLNGQKDYSIDEFLDYLHETGYYDIIQNVKISYGNEVAINLCLGLTHNFLCEEVVRVYMAPSGSCPIDPKTPIEDVLKEIKASEYFKKEIVKLYEEVNDKGKYLILIIVSSYDILRKKMEEKEILILTKKMISKDFLIN